MTTIYYQFPDGTILKLVLTSDSIKAQTITPTELGQIQASRALMITPADVEEAQS